MGASEPRVTISSLRSDGVVLLGSSDPRFHASFKATRDKRYDPLLPYTVVIQNNTEQEIIAYTVVWNCASPDGRLSRRVRNVYDFSKLTPGANLLPGKKDVVSLVYALEAGGQNWVESDTLRLTEFFSKQERVEIALDAVMFADGTAIGADYAHTIPRWQAWLDGEKGVLTAAAAQTSESTVRELMQGLAQEGVALHRQQGGDGIRNASEFAILAEHANSYEECIRFTRAYFASAILRDLDAQGTQMLQNVRTIVASKRYPTVHSKKNVD